MTAIKINKEKLNVVQETKNEIWINLTGKTPTAKKTLTQIKEIIGTCNWRVYKFTALGRINLKIIVDNQTLGFVSNDTGKLQFCIYKNIIEC